MNATLTTDSSHSRLMYLAIGLAIFAALGDLLIALNVLTIGNLSTAGAPPAIVHVAALCYLIGGLMILPRSRILLMAGAAINAMMIVCFFNLYPNNQTVLFFTGEVATKGAQLLLEGLLICLIIAGWRTGPMKSSHPKQG